ncbi:MAG: hypothetical protein IPI81_12830 [Flavobacteriales bacterium]|nr:hypothetical protein [Flavobacteriales bacterium]MCC6937983.1 hypothetical protein [Flavobacteriales bacterium]
MIADPRTPSGDAVSAVGSTGAVLCTLQYPPVKPFRDHAFVSFPSDTGGIGPTVFFDPASSN